MFKRFLFQTVAFLAVSLVFLTSQTAYSDTVLLKDIAPGSNSFYPSNLTDFKGALYFTGEDGMAAIQRSDGTAEGTKLFKQFDPDESGGDPGALVVALGKLFFRGTLLGHGAELWVSDGTPEGTVITKDIWPGTESGLASWPMPWRNNVLFIADDGVSGRQFWTSDGTNAGTQPFVDDAVSVAASARNFSPFGDGWLFKSTDSVHGAELWYTDGTEGNSRLVKDIVPGPEGSFSSDSFTFADVGDWGVFFVWHEDRTELWRTDGTESGTQYVWTLPEDEGVEPYYRLIPYNDLVLFFLMGPDFELSLWRTDGTEAGTLLVKGGFFDEPGDFIEYDNLLYISLGTMGEVAEYELWRTDGTSAGTQLFLDLNPGAFGSSPHSMTHYAGSILFVANDGRVGEELFLTDGTVAGTRLVTDINPGAESSQPDYLTLSQGSVFFYAWEPVHGVELYKTTIYTEDVSISGSVESSRGDKLCAMVLASGKYDFSCNPDGPFSLQNLPRELDGTIKRQVYADGFFPRVDVLDNSSSETIVLQRSGKCPEYNSPYTPMAAPSSAGNFVDIRGSILQGNSGTPLCAMVLANGAYMFSCDGSGNYDLNVPLDANGQFKLQVYADGFAPYTARFDENQTVNNIKMARAAECK